jgi:hypothetical protein
MGKASRIKKERNFAGLTEGEFTVSFVFDNKLHHKRHQLTAFEIKHMKDLCTEHGDFAADQMIWRTAVKGIGVVAENIMAKAAQDYIKGHFKGRYSEVFETGAETAKELQLVETALPKESQ